jgi:hypothetical protein
MASTRGGSKRSSKKGPAGGRVTSPTRHTGTRTGRYVSAEERGRYTPPVPRSAHQSPAWYGPFIIGIFLLGLLTVILNYLAVLPGSVSSWYLFSGIVIIFIGFAAMLRYH